MLVTPRGLKIKGSVSKETVLLHLRSYYMIKLS